MSTSDPTVAEFAEDPTRLAEIARLSAIQVLDDCLRYGHAPERYRDVAIRNRAVRDVVCDLERDIELGHSHSIEQAERYRVGYVAAFLAAWRDRALLRELRAKHAARGVIIVCSR